MSGSVISSTYCACPVTLSRPSLRGTDTPTMRSPFIESDYRIPAAAAIVATLARSVLLENYRPQKHTAPADTSPSPPRAKSRLRKATADTGSATVLGSPEMLCPDQK